jgi:putative methionine-R-sulfoxide reductase with GAF domain
MNTAAIQALPLQIKSLLQVATSRKVPLTQVLQLVLTAYQSETGTIHRLDGEKQLLHLAAQIGVPPFLMDTINVIPVGKGIAGQTVERGGPVTICNLQTDTGGIAKPDAKKTGVGGALCVPLRSGGKIVGTIGVGTQRPYEYTAVETQMLEEIGKIIGEHLD